MRIVNVAGARPNFVGNVMLDSLKQQLAAASRSTIMNQFGLVPGRFGLVTLHRPANVDDPGYFAAFLGFSDRSE
jgi:UDP-N-acetylglucosamine 2-epimerase (non-hydrolysing)